MPAIRNRYAYLTMLIQMWSSKSDVLFLSSLSLGKVDSLQKFSTACVTKFLCVF